MKYLKWSAVVLLAIAGFAIYGSVSSGASLSFAVTEAAPLFLIAGIVLAVVYAGIAGFRKLKQ